MKTQEFLSASETELVPRLKTMKIKELERHAQKIIKNHGTGDYTELMRQLIKTIPTLDPMDNQRFAVIQNLVSEYINVDTLAQKEQAPNIIQRLTVLLTVIITRKFHKIHNAQPDTPLH